MLLYHASTTIVAKPRIFRGEVGRDFGFGFYVTTDLALARRWAWRQADILAAQTGGLTKAIINVHRWPGPEGLTAKDFPARDGEWLAMVTAGRKQAGLHHDFDLVRGPVSDGDAGMIINLLEAGKLKAEVAGRLLAQLPAGAAQIALCTPRAIASMHYQNSVELRERAEMSMDESVVTAEQQETAVIVLDEAVAKLIGEKFGEALGVAWQQSATRACLERTELGMASLSALQIFQLWEEERDYGRRATGEEP